MDLKEKINLSNLPKHIAIIMDGNGRWAKQQGEHRIFGHENGVKSVKDTVEAAAELGIEFLTLYAFSTENWNRPQEEVIALMQLLVHTISNETKTLNENNIRLKAIGDLKSLPADCYNELQDAISKTKNLESSSTSRKFWLSRTIWNTTLNQSNPFRGRSILPFLIQT